MKCIYIIQSKLFTLLPVKNKTTNNKDVVCQLYSIQLQKEVKSNPKQPSCKKKYAAQTNEVQKRCEIQGSDKEITVMVG